MTGSGKPITLARRSMMRPRGSKVVLTLSLVCGIGAVTAPIALAGPHRQHGPGCGHEKTVIRIGALVDQTGASTSPLFRSAVELAAAQMNEALEKRHSRLAFELVLGDTKSTPAVAQAEALRLINEEGVKALVSDSSGDTVAVNKLNYDPASPALNKVPVTCFQCSSGFINNPTVVETDPLTQAAERDLDNWLYRVFYIANYEAAVQVQIALQQPNGGDRNGDGLLKIAIYADAGHRSLATAIGPTLPNFYTGPSSIEITYMSSLANIPAEWPLVVDGLNGTTPDGEPDLIILAMLPGNVASAVQAYRQAGYTLPLQSNNSLRRNYLLAQLGTLAEGIEGSSVAAVNSSRSGEIFTEAFEEATGSLPELTSSGAYDSAMTLMLAAMVAAGDVMRPTDVTPEEIRSALALINNPRGLKIRPSVRHLEWAAFLLRRGLPINYDGAYNANDWNEVGDIFPPLVHWKVENGQFVETQQFQCDPANPLCVEIQ
jgi:ABC-type branched-subunit amino acid transport system substrate-binding protein